MITRRAAIVVAALSLWGGRLHAQTTFATITGTVFDASGAAVPNASITVTSLETNYKNSAQSNESGNYTIPQLREGAYSLTARAGASRNSPPRGSFLPRATSVGSTSG